MIVRCFVGLAACALVLCIGCNDPIYDSYSISPNASGVSLSTDSDRSRYDWPLMRDGYVVAKPPPMAYVTSFEEKLVRPDPVTAPLIPWSNEGLDDAAIEFLDHAYSDISLDLDVKLRLSISQFQGPQAFDVSVDGKRLVTLDDQGIGLYKTERGELVGHMKLPDEASSGENPVLAIRFAGDSGDFLLASAKTIFRVSGKTGRVVAQTSSSGEPIAQWNVTLDDKSMLMRGESGRLYGGDTQLGSFSPYKLGQHRVFEHASLSADGKRIGVVVDNRPRIYHQDEYQIIDQEDYDQVQLDPNV